jgi:hypothetical protein
LWARSKRLPASFLAAGQVEDQAGVQVLEQRVPFGALQLVDRSIAALASLAP